jgi:MFS family permease
MLMGLLPGLALWLLLRTALGFCFAGMFVVVESWLNEITETARRGRVLAYYMITIWAATGVGKASFAVTEPDHLAAFALVSIAISLALVPVALTAGITPEKPVGLRLSLRDLYAAAPVAVIGCFMTGASNGAFWMLAPVFAQARTDTQTAVALFMTVAVAGGALSQWPIGRLSDGLDRRWVILLTTVAAAAAAGLIAIFPDAPTAQLLALSGAFGVFALPIYALCIAHANDRMAPGMFVNASGQLLLLFGLGAAIGPILASLVADAVGPRGVFFYIAAAQLLFGALTVARLIQRQRAAAPADAFVIMPRTTHAAAQFDPRADTDKAEIAQAEPRFR